jgi:hypothetical protein
LLTEGLCQNDRQARSADAHVALAIVALTLKVVVITGPPQPIDRHQDKNQIAIGSSATAAGMLRID